MGTSKALDRFDWLKSKYEQEFKILSRLFPKNTGIRKGFDFMLSCRTPENQLVEAKVVGVEGDMFLCEHPRTNALFTTNVVEPFEVLRFIEAYMEFEKPDFDPLVELMLKRMGKKGYGSEFCAKSIKTFEDAELKARYHEWLDLPDDFDFSIAGFCKDRLGLFKVVSVCMDKFICLDESHDMFVMRTIDRMPFEALRFMDDFEQYNNNHD